MPPNIRKLPNDLALKAQNTINEDDERISEDLKSIRNWLTKQPHLNVRNDDQWLLTFLRGCKYSLERTKEKLDTFYMLRTLIPEFFKNKDPTQPELKALIDTGLFLPLENKTDPTGPCLLFFKQGDYDPTKVDIVDIFKYLFIILDILMYEDDNLSVSGLVVICDLKGVTLTHMAQFTPGLAKKSVSTVQIGYPIRQKGVHFINTPAGFDTLFSLLKAFASEKLKKRYHVHKTIDSLYKFIPKENFPMELGGSIPMDEMKEKWRIKIASYKNWLIEDEQYYSDEKLRLGKSKTAESLFGIEGSFRKLNID